MVYHRFIFHLSRCFRAAARAFALTFFAIGINSVSLAGATPLASCRLTSPYLKETIAYCKQNYCIQQTS